jgi:putative lipoprotein
VRHIHHKHVELWLNEDATNRTMKQLGLKTILSLCLSAIGLFAAASAPITFTGTISFANGAALPTGAKLEVRLLNVSMADASSETMTTVTKKVAGSKSPLKYRLTIDSDKLIKKFSYSIDARIRVGENLYYVQPEAVLIRSTEKGGTYNLSLQKMNLGPALDSSLPGTNWIPYELNGKRLKAGRANLELSFEAVGPDPAHNEVRPRFNGFAGVNRFFGTYEAKGDRLKVSGVASTKMAGPEALMSQEDAFFKALEKVTRVQIVNKNLVMFAGTKAIIRCKPNAVG